MELAHVLAQTAASYEGLSPTVALVISLAWFFLLGGCIGSFMNVVIYRVPAGLSIVHPGSRCPKCEHEIRAYDNIPMLGWLNLRGKCRDCGAPISARYPLVEALVALVFVVVAWAEPLSYGANLPPTKPSFDDTPSLLWLLFAGHVVLLCTLICAALIQYDGHAVPPKLFLPALIGAIGVMAYWSDLRTLPLSIDDVPPGWLAGLRFSFQGAAAGGLLGVLSRAGTKGTPGLTAPLLSGAAIGAMLGWQAVATIFPVTAVCVLLITLLGCAGRSLWKINWHAGLALLTGIFVVGWRPITEPFDWIGSGANWQTIAFAAIVVLTFSFAAARVARARTDTPSANERKIPS